ncbi:polyphosphate polymerase domain-containing protein [Plantactinospora solaniradicis]|uniref:Polyphosphate polymerase domain-containing protein n=1 Tax=Plantactinospora solaniradicis TaxID=1723736 RepID=A0ABW1KFY6_9ACTN
MAPIGLTELTEHAALLARTDRKYLLPLPEVSALLPELAPDTRVLQIGAERLFRYQSVYFDTPELTSFRSTVHRRRRRFKIRTRTYLDSGTCWLEVKTEGTRGGTVKNRLPYRCADDATVAPGRWFVESVLSDLAVAGHTALVFDPTLVTRYRRSTLYLPASASRLTIDVDLHWQDDGHRQLDLPHLAVIETKTRSAPSAADRLLWARGHRPTSISKYATALAALHPELPAAPWRRTLRRHFIPAA